MYEAEAKEQFGKLSNMVDQNHEIAISLIGKGQYIDAERIEVEKIRNCRTNCGVKKTSK